jgi:putative transposase
MARRKAPSIPDDLLDQLLGGMDAASALNSPDWMNALKKALAERALSAEMDYHLGDEAEAENSRNGYGRKTVSRALARSTLRFRATGPAVSIRS